MEALNTVLPIVIYLLLIVLLIVGIILGIKLIITIDEVNAVIEDIRKKVKSLNQKDKISYNGQLIEVVDALDFFTPGQGYGAPAKQSTGANGDLACLNHRE